MKAAACHKSRKHYAKGLCTTCYLKDYDSRTARNRQLKCRYGISLQEWEARYEEQGRVCKICRRAPSSPRATHTDHDHATGKFRGILCSRCNVFVAYVERNVSMLGDLLKYILEGKT